MIGERIHHARDACGLTQQELAAAAGLSQGTVSEIEAGRVLNPAEDTVARIAQATQFPVNFFYRGPLPTCPKATIAAWPAGR